MTDVLEDVEITPRPFFIPLQHRFSHLEDNGERLHQHVLHGVEDSVIDKEGRKVRNKWNLEPFRRRPKKTSSEASTGS